MVHAEKEKILKLEDVVLDNYVKKLNDKDEIHNLYINCYNSLKSDIGRIRYASHLGSLHQSFKDQQSEINDTIYTLQQEVNQQIYDWAQVEHTKVNLNVRRLKPPRREFYDDTDTTDTAKNTTDYLVIFIDHFIDTLKFGLSDISYKFETINHVFSEVEEKIEDNSGQYPDFSNFQKIISNCIDNVALYDHWKAITEIHKEIAQKNYPQELEKDRILITPEPRGLNQIKIDQIIKDVAKGITDKGSSTYNPKTIEIYLEVYIERESLTRDQRIKICISIANDEKVIKEFTDKCRDNTLSSWEKKFDKAWEKYESVVSL